MDEFYSYQDIKFEWDNNKQLANQIKHNLLFYDAVQVFFDPFLVSLVWRGG